jgi:hypothetical protein
MSDERLEAVRDESKTLSADELASLQQFAEELEALLPPSAIPPDELEKFTSALKALSLGDLKGFRNALNALSLDAMKGFQRMLEVLESPIEREAAMRYFFEHPNVAPMVKKMPREDRVRLEGQLDELAENLGLLLHLSITEPENKPLINLCLETIIISDKIWGQLGFTENHLRLAKSYERSSLGKKSVEKRKPWVAARWAEARDLMNKELAKHPEIGRSKLASEIGWGWKGKDAPSHDAILKFLRKELGPVKPRSSKAVDLTG